MVIDDKQAGLVARRRVIIALALTDYAIGMLQKERFEISDHRDTPLACTHLVLSLPPLRSLIPGFSGNFLIASVPPCKISALPGLAGNAARNDTVVCS